MSRIYTLESRQVVPLTLVQAWDFFSSPQNLKRITPPSMGFDITSDGSGVMMYPGMIITYRIRPFLGIPITWVTEITHVTQYEYFVDEQRVGPYSFWHHKHFFREVVGGVEVCDLVHYRMPFSFFGSIVHRLAVRKQLEWIFNYRKKKLEELFPTMRMV
jgi:ligand-binding SRPBCC domain-containing protein